MTTLKSRPEPYHDATIYRWLRILGYKHRRVTKGIYLDGHERPDVVAYRRDFLVRMAEYRRRATQYVDAPDGSHVAVELDLQENEMKVVFVYHDESCFAANDGKRCLWLEEGEKVLRPKGDGKSIMVIELTYFCSIRQLLCIWVTRLQGFFAPATACFPTKKSPRV